MPTISVSEYWFQWLAHVVESGIRKSKAVVIMEALARHRRAIENEIQEYRDVQEEIKERKEI